MAPASLVDFLSEGSSESDDMAAPEQCDDISTTLLTGA